MLTIDIRFTYIGDIFEHWSSDENYIRRELCCTQYFQGLGLDVQYRHLPLFVNFPDRLELRSVHCVLVRTCDLEMMKLVEIEVIRYEYLPYSRYSLEWMSFIISSCDMK